MHGTTLITGASGGIGRELARVFARKGHHLMITARREHLLTDLKKELETEFDIQVHVLAGDLGSAGGPGTLFSFAQEHNLVIDTLVNNAGFGDYGFFHESEWQKQAAMIDVNIKSLTHLTCLFLPAMIERRHGYIMNVASTAAFQPGPLMSVYCATKHFVLAFSEAIANELRGTGVSVTALCPGPTTSGFQEASGMQKSRLVNLMPLPNAREVAEFGYKSMKKRKRVAVHGFSNKLLSVVGKFLPRNTLTAVVRAIQSPK